MAGSKRHVQEPLGGAGIGGGEPVHPMGRRDDRVQGRQALTGRAVQQVDAVKMQQIEEEGGQRLRGASRRDVDAAILPALSAPRPNRDAVAWAPATTTSSTTGCGCEVPTAGFQGNFL